ncbi:MAG: hypothetical protein VB102_12200 [Paludibacter sp.]|nr:hypothetical protein [Paludibacter sp.]
MKDPKERFLRLFDNNEIEHFFSANYLELKYTITVYELLKKHYKSGGSIVDNVYFKSLFGQFYAMTPLFAPPPFIDNFYIEMENVRRKTESNGLDISALTNKLCGNNEKDKLQFSFISKLMNIENDELYPIYDSKVISHFPFKSLPNQKETRLKQLVERYKIITQTYFDLLEDEKALCILRLFKEKFDCFNSTNMRIVDVIFWQLGKWDEKHTN